MSPGWSADAGWEEERRATPAASAPNTSRRPSDALGLFDSAPFEASHRTTEVDRAARTPARGAAVRRARSALGAETTDILTRRRGL